MEIGGKEGISRTCWRPEMRGCLKVSTRVCRAMKDMDPEVAISSSQIRLSVEG